jgi:hypothetical protein
MGGDQGLVVDAAAYQSADVPAVLDAAPPENDASTDASLAADRRPLLSRKLSARFSHKFAEIRSLNLNA